MKRPTVASLKRVTPENLLALGPERLAELLAAAAQNRPELKRQLRMELAAEQGPEHLNLEIDRRLGSLQTSRGKVSWRQRPTFVRDLDVLRALIAERLARLDPAAALQRLWLFMDLARQVAPRVRDRDGSLEAVFATAAADIGALMAQAGDLAPVDALVDALVASPSRWAAWLPAVLVPAPPAAADPALARRALERAAQRTGSGPGWITALRHLADAAGDVDAFAATFSPAALREPIAGAQLARRLLAAGRIAEAGAVLDAASPARLGRGADLDHDWETVWIDWLEQSGQGPDAQAARWAAFERTLSAERARDFTRRLPDFDDVEAEGRAFAYAAAHPDLTRALQFLMDWPALAEAARLIAARADELKVAAGDAEAWAAKLRTRHPAAATTLLRKAAAAAFRRRDFATCDRLTAEADAIEA